MTKMVKIEQHLIEKAWENWLDFHYGLDCEETMERWCRCLDETDKSNIDPWGDDASEKAKVLPDAAVRVRLMAGSNHYTFIKAWYVNNPWK